MKGLWRSGEEGGRREGKMEGRSDRGKEGSMFRSALPPPPSFSLRSLLPLMIIVEQ